METVEIKTKNPTGKKRLSLGAAALSVFLHVGLFLLVGGLVVVEYAIPRHPVIGELSREVNSEEVAPPEDTPEPASEPDAAEATSASAAPASEPAPLDLSAGMVDVIRVDSSIPNFKMATIGGSGGMGSAVGTSGQSSGTSGTGHPGKTRNPFGGEDKSDNSWEGVLYDLKQTKNGKPTGMDPNKYSNIIREFFSKNWDRKVLGDYYQVSKKLYATQIYMPLVGADAAPKAFGVEAEVKPSQWAIIYTGTFTPSKTGQFRFAGYADDILAVNVDGKNVLDGSRITMVFEKGSALAMVKIPGQDFVPKDKVANGSLAYSEWFRFKEGDKHKIQILVGEQPGGEFCAYLFIEEKGREYKKTPEGRSILPLFRTTENETPVSGEAVFENDDTVFGTK